MVRQFERAARVVSTAAILLVACLVAPAASPAQDAPRSRAVFSTRSELVVLHVSVLDHKSGFVPGLPRETFRVYDNGQLQELTYFQNEDSPVTVGLVIDSSGSMQPKRDAVIAAGLAFAQSSHPQDEMFTVNFNEKVWPGLPGGRPFTSDLGELREALLQSTARGQTALFDAIRFALTRLENGHQQKKVLIVISDGGDNASVLQFRDVMHAAARMDAVVYTIGMYDPDDREARPGLLKEIAEATGAEAFFPRRLEEVARILDRIAHDIRSGYTLGYTPSGTSQAAGFHAVRVEVSPPDRRKLSVRSRSRYFAGSQ
jgi:VWFA-related protein